MSLQPYRLFPVLAAAFLLLSGGCSDSPAPNLEEQARDIHARILTVDTHVDTPFNLLREDWKIGDRHNFEERGGGRVDLPRMIEGGLDAVFFAVFVGQGPLTPEGYQQARERADRVLEAVHDMCREYGEVIGLALDPDDAYRLKKEGRRVAFIGMENGYPLGTNLDLLRDYHQRGIRYLGLVHGSDNQICDSSTDRRNPEDNGLSAFGRDVVLECNRLGLMVDLSHASDRTFTEVLEITRAPVIASHSSVRALCDSPRNLNDDMLRALAENGGVIQICFLSSYLRTPAPNPEREAALKDLTAKYGNLREIEDEELRKTARTEYEDINVRFPLERASVKDVVDHIDHVIRIAGEDHVGIGTDFDGGGGVVGCEDASGMMNVTVEMLRRGYSEERIEKIWGGNIMRVFRDVIAVAADLSDETGDE
ncbi:MAG: dipeptidase [Acidobacteriota bacterium]|nr:dipeptidase [Acidobacteriota bacterium]